MTRGIAVLVCVTAAFATSDEPGRPLSNDDVIRLVRAGFGDSAVRQAIAVHRPDFDVSHEGAAALRASGVSEPLIEAMSAARSDHDHLRLLDPGIYVKRGDTYALVQAEPVVWRRVASEPAGEFTLVFLAGQVQNRQSRLALSGAVELLIVAPPGKSGTAYVLVRAEEKQDFREFRLEAALLDGTVAGFGGRTAVAAGVDVTFDLGVRVLLGASARKGEYGVVPPGVPGQIHTFTLE